MPRGTGDGARRRWGQHPGGPQGRCPCWGGDGSHGGRHPRRAGTVPTGRGPSPVPVRRHTDSTGGGGGGVGGGEPSRPRTAPGTIRPHGAPSTHAAGGPCPCAAHPPGRVGDRGGGRDPLWGRGWRRVAGARGLTGEGAGGPPPAAPQPARPTPPPSQQPLRPAPPPPPPGLHIPSCPGLKGRCRVSPPAPRAPQLGPGTPGGSIWPPPPPPSPVVRLSPGCTGRAVAPRGQG